MSAQKHTALAITLMLGVTAPAFADVQMLTVHNETDQNIVELTVDEYGDRGELELLDGDTLQAGESITAEIGMDEDAGDEEAHDCIGDVHADFEDGSSDVMEDVNICDDHDIVFD